MVVERHSAWEPTSPHYDTTRYGEDPSYTYAAIYDYGTHFYQMSRLSESAAIDDESLSQCDVLVIKTPTEPYRSEEAAAVARFVGRGGGLLMIGDHTNCDRWSTHLNAVARPFGFQFRYDILFPVGSPYVELIQPPAIPHPILQNVGPFHFAGTCSLDPGASLGRAVVLTTGKWSLPPDYHTENYFPQAEYRPDMRYGAFIQLWSTRYGRGRVLAIADSTLFSNFCTFEPGKSELMLGMLEWLNRRSLFDYWAVRLLFWLVLGLAALAGLGLAAWLVLVAGGRGTSAGPDVTGLLTVRHLRTDANRPASEACAWTITIRTGKPTSILPLVSAGLLGWTVGLAGRAGDPSCRDASAADRAPADPGGRRSHGLRSAALLQRLYRRERQRIRPLGTVDPAAGLFSLAPQRAGGTVRQRSADPLPDPAHQRRLPQSPGRLRGRRRPAVADRFPGEQRDDGQQPALPLRAGGEGCARRPRRAEVVRPLARHPRPTDLRDRGRQADPLGRQDARRRHRRLRQRLGAGAGLRLASERHGHGPEIQHRPRRQAPDPLRSSLRLAACGRHRPAAGPRAGPSGGETEVPEGYALA